MSDTVTFFQNYTPVGDILTLALCILFIVLIKTAYINRTKAFMYLKINVVLLFGSAVSNILYHILLNYLDVYPIKLPVYIFRTTYHICLFGMFVHYVYYMKEPMRLDERHDKRYGLIAVIGFAVLALWEVIGTVTHLGYYIDDNNGIHMGFPLFPIGYVAYLFLLGYLLIKYRDKVFKQVIMGVTITVGLSVLILCVQQVHRQSSYTSATFTFPVIALLYLVHSNPYNISSGALGIAAFEDKIKSSYDKKKELLFMSLYLPEFDKNGRTYPDEILSTIRYFVTNFFKEANLFQLSGGHMIMVIDTELNPGYMESNSKMIGEFNKVYPIYKNDYKIVSIMSDDRLSANKDYSAFIDYIHRKMPMNSIYRVEEKDINEFYNQRYILSQLEDIVKRKDLNDPRVEVYCQPVFNIQKGIYDTAEALMRLKLPELGMVFPDVFIPIAERSNCVHMLTKIILNKTCRQINTLIKRGYNVRRISVNFSIFDVRDNDFCSTVQRIIRENEIEHNKIAIEITESQNESDFEIIKERINELKGSGIKFYLDDFGTGYSNFERIMELPFDIIKFDRSLVIASSNDQKMKEMVSHLAKMFSDMNYAILYEGIEDEEDEARCKEMSAKYLQGYKYSRPIPIKELTEYFSKIS